MDIATRLTKDIAELAAKLRKFYEFYYALVEAKQIHLDLRSYYISKSDVEIVYITKEERDRWFKIKKIIDDFEVP